MRRASSDRNDGRQASYAQSSGWAARGANGPVLDKYTAHQGRPHRSTPPSQGHASSSFGTGRTIVGPAFSAHCCSSGSKNLTDRGAHEAALIKPSHRLPTLQDAKICWNVLQQNVMQFMEQPFADALTLPVGVGTDRANARNLDVLPTHTDHPPPKAELRQWPPFFRHPQMMFRLAAPVRHARPEVSTLRIGPREQTTKRLFQRGRHVSSDRQVNVQEPRSGWGIRVFASP